MIKPDAVARGRTGAIISRIEAADLRIVALKMWQLTPGQAHAFYGEHRGKPFYEGLIRFMTEGPLVAMVLEGENAVERWRSLMGATDPHQAAPGTLRQQFGSELPRNAVHGSDSPESAEREMRYFFSGMEVFSRG